MKALAEKYHDGQFRKGEERLPYIVHPQAVAATLVSWGEPENSVAVSAAWGHDLLEDTTVTESEIIAASSQEVLDCIKLLTHSDDTDKASYLRNVSRCGNRDVLLVKIADRICNTSDFVKLKGKLHAFRYLHSADVLVPALEKLSGDQVVKNALAAWKNIDGSLKDDAQRETLRGCLIGGAVGDALGSPVEFLDLQGIEDVFGGAVDDYVEFRDGTGAITDDTQMTLFTAEGILRAFVRGQEKGICHPASVVKNAYLRWLKTQGVTVPLQHDIFDGWLIGKKELFSCRAPGMTCLAGLQQNTLNAVNRSKGCGTIMRVAPAGLFYAPCEAYEKGCEFSAITHGHPTGIISGGAFAMLISYLHRGKSLSDALGLVEEHLEKTPDAEETLLSLRAAKSAKSVAELGEGWVANETLAIAVYCALHYEHDFKSGVLEAINITGDSDSTGAVAGNILGVINGEHSIPEKWRKNLREYRIVSEIADDLHLQIENDESGHVTEMWWNKYPGH